MRIAVTLSAPEQAIARYLAKQKRERSQAAGFRDKQQGPQSGDEIQLEGIGAELAFCKLFNVYPQLEVDRTDNFDACVLGHRIDVKSTRYANGHLLALLEKETHPADVYALMVGKFPDYVFAGMIAADAVFRPDRIRDFGNGNTYAVPQSDLQSVDEWRADFERAMISAAGTTQAPSVASRCQADT